MKNHSLTRRKFLSLLGLAGAGALLPRGLHASSADLVRVSIINTTDLHGNILPTFNYQGEGDLGGFARCASMIRKWKLANPESLLLDAGDVFQGTDVGWRTRGKIMMKCFNALNYDAWAVGNHEFDWGMDAFAGCLEESAMPPLSANSLLEGKMPGDDSLGKSGLGKIQPSILKQVGGLKIGVIGLTTPGLPGWFLPSFTKGFEAVDPAQAAARQAAILKEQGADAIVILAHMGQRSEDDHANRLNSVAAAVPDAALIIGGHTHRDVPSAQIGGVPYSQSLYFGIRLGLADLFFNPETRKLVRVETSTHPVDTSTAPDPAILSLAAADLEESAQALAAPAGRLGEPFSARSDFGTPSEMERLIAASIFEAMSQRGASVDAVWHGTFSSDDWAAGEKTVADVWGVMPFENFVAVGEFTPGEMLAAFRDAYGNSRRPSRSLMGLKLIFSGGGDQRQLEKVVDANGQQLNPAKRYRVAMNTYDAASGGGRMPVLGELMRSAKVNATIHPVQTREALISFLNARAEAGVNPGAV